MVSKLRVFALVATVLLAMVAASGTARADGLTLGIWNQAGAKGTAVGAGLSAWSQDNPEGTEWRNPQWYLDGDPIPGATNSSLTLLPEHVGGMISVQAEGRAPGADWVSVTSAQVGPVVLGEPAISVDLGREHLFIGAQLEASLSIEPSGADVALQWLADGTPVAGATSDSISLTKSLVGKTLALSVTASADGYESVTKVFEVERVIRDTAVAGEVSVDHRGRQAEVNRGHEWYPWALTFTYDWMIDGKVVQRGTSRLLDLTSDWNGKTLTVRMTGSNAALKAASSTSAPLVLKGIPADPVPELDVYTTPGRHSHNGREWNTTCEPYSQTTRCRTEIIARTVQKQADGSYLLVNDWAFNNLTYLPSEATLWRGNPLGTPGEWTAADGRRWKTECYSTELPHICRSYAWTHYMVADADGPGSTGHYTYRAEQGWVFNNQVHLR